MADCCLIKKVATVEVYENKNEVRAYGFMAGDRNTPVMEVRFKHLWGESNLSNCKLRWIIVDDVGSLLVGEVPIQSDNTALINLPNELFTGDRRMKVQLTVASCDGERILNLQQFTDLKVINSLATNEVVQPVYQLLINQLYDDTKVYLTQLETSYNAKYGSLETLYANSKASLEQYLVNAENGGNAEFLQGYAPHNFKKTEDTIANLKASTKYKLGEVVEVLGYYSIGDGAGHKRKIEETDDGSGVQLANGLWANVVHNGEVNVSWFGAKGDGVTDDAVAIQRAIDVAFLITGENKTYNVVPRMIPVSINGVTSDSEYGFVITNDKKITDMNLTIPSSTEWYTTFFRIFLNQENTEIQFHNVRLFGNGHTLPISTPKRQDGGMHGIRVDKHSQFESLATIELKINECEFHNIGTDALNLTGLSESPKSTFDIKNTFFNKSRRASILFGVGSIYVRDCELVSTNMNAMSVFGNRCSPRIFSEPETDLTTETIELHNVRHNHLEETNAIQFFKTDYVRGVAEYKKIQLENCTTNCALYEVSSLGILNSESLKFGKVKINNCVSSGDIRMCNDVTSVDFYTSYADFSVTNSDFNVMSTGKSKVENLTLKSCKLSNFQNTETSEPVVKKTYIEDVEFQWGTKTALSQPAIFATGEVKIKNIKIYADRFSEVVFRSYILIYNSTNVEVSDVYFEGSNLQPLILKSCSGECYIQNIEMRKKKTVPSDTVVSFQNSQFNKLVIRKFVFLNSTRPHNYITTGSEELLILDFEDLTQNTAQAYVLNTPYHSTKMQQEGVYEDFIQYMDAKTEYDRLQRELERQRQLAFEQRENQEQTYEEWLAEQPRMLPVENEPQPSEKLLAFKTKYIG